MKKTNRPRRPTPHHGGKRSEGKSYKKPTRVPDIRTPTLRYFDQDPVCGITRVVMSHVCVFCFDSSSQAKGPIDGRTEALILPRLLHLAVIVPPHDALHRTEQSLKAILADHRDLDVSLGDHARCARLVV